MNLPSLALPFSLLIGAVLPSAFGQTPPSESSPILIAFDLKTDPEADLDEAVPHTKTTLLHPGLELTDGLRLGVLQKAQNGPGLMPRSSLVSWVFFGVGSGSGTSGDDTSANSLQAAIENNLYFTFSVAPKPGLGLNLSSATLTAAFSFTSGGRANGPTHCAVLSSATGFTADQALAVTTDINNKVAVFELSHPGLTNITSPVEFRVYCWRADGNAIDASGLSLRQIPGIAVGNGGNVVLTGEVFELSGN
jgi:hypothetical protein